MLKNKRVKFFVLKIFYYIVSSELQNLNNFKFFVKDFVLIVDIFWKLFCAYYLMKIKLGFTGLHEPCNLILS